MARRAKKDGFAIDLIGETEVRRQFFAGQEVPEGWQVEDADAVEEFEKGQSVVYAQPPYESPGRGMSVGPDDPDSSHAGMAANAEARKQAAKRAREKGHTGEQDSASTASGNQ